MNKDFLLDVENLSASINEKILIKNFSLQIKKNESHVLMGPNGSGKSTISKILSGHPSYKIEKGTIFFNKKDLVTLSPEERSYEGLFLAFQYPLEIQGVKNQDFLLEIYNAHAKQKGFKKISPIEFLNLIKPKMDLINMNIDFLRRDINEGFSGGEKKRNELLQLLLLQPKLIILDEIDSGLDIDSMKIVTKTLNTEFHDNTSFLIITHYNRFLEYLKPDIVHVMQNGQIIKTGTAELGKFIEKNGFKWIK
jgi:Fe-S cluster assembly ATP-binding protein